MNKKKPEIIFEENALEYVVYISYSLILTTCLFLLLCYISYKTFINTESSEKFEKLKKKLQPLLDKLKKLNVFYRSYEIIFKKFGTGSPYVFGVIAIMKKIIDYSYNKKFIIILFFVSLPRIIILIVFFIEILSGHLHYYFYTLYLLLIPLFFKIVLFLLRDLQERVFPEADGMVIQEIVPITINDKTSLRLTFTLKPEHNDLDPNLYFPNLYFPLLYFGGYIGFITDMYTKIQLFTQCLYYFCHILGLSYILIISFSG